MSPFGLELERKPAEAIKRSGGRTMKLGDFPFYGPRRARADEFQTVTLPKRVSPQEGPDIMSGSAPSETILDEATRLVANDRDADYGHPFDAYTPVGRIWGAILKIPDIPPAIVCLMLSAMKIGRHSVRKKRDNLVDVAGYARTVEMCEEREHPIVPSTPVVQQFYRPEDFTSPLQGMTATEVNARKAARPPRPDYITRFPFSEGNIAMEANRRLLPRDGSRYGVCGFRYERGGRVVYVVVVENRGNFAVGSAVLQPGDKEDRAIGLQIAVGQAFKNMARGRYVKPIGVSFERLFRTGPPDLEMRVLVGVLANRAIIQADERKASGR